MYILIKYNAYASPSDIISKSKDVVTLIPSVVRTIQKLRQSNDEKDIGISEVLNQIEDDCRHGCKQLLQELTSLEQSLRRLKLDSKSLATAYADLSWYNIISRRRLNRHRKAINSIEIQLESAVDDFISVLMCKGRVEDVSNGAEIGVAIRRDLEITNSETLGDTVKRLKKIVARYQDEIRG